MSKASPNLLLALLATVAFSLATSLELRVTRWDNPARSGGAFTKLLGEGRRLFANQFITMADVYLHSGYYPSIFDQRDTQAPKAISGGASDEDEHGEHANEAGQHDEDEHEKAMDFLGKPQNWLDAFIRHFRITKHTHLENGQEREVLPWLRIAIDLDPQKIETYTSTAYWLRKKLGRVKDAEQVLREGIRNNPNNPELLFEMGLLYYEGYHDTNRAGNTWSLALRRWEAQSEAVKKDSTDILGKIAINFARMEESAGNLRQSLPYFEMAARVSPEPEPLQKHIAEIRTRLEALPNFPRKPVP
jgi:tetratricopeptide (TPR) repeat protein